MSDFFDDRARIVVSGIVPTLVVCVNSLFV